MHPFICSLASKYKHFGHFLFNNLPVAKSLIAYAIFEQLVKIKIVLHQKVDIAAIKLHRFFAHHCTGWPNIKVKWSTHINTTSLIPLKCTNTKLKSIHSGATMFEFLI